MTGRSTIEHVTADAVVPVDEDLAGYTIQAYLRDEEEPTGYRVVTGAQTELGRFRIDGVPEDVEYTLKLVPPGSTVAYYFVTSRRELDLGHAVGGRPDGVPVTRTQNVQLQLTDLQAWQAGDRLVATTYHTATECEVPGPAVGAGAVDVTFDWSGPACVAPALVDASAGDRIEVAHVRSTGQFDGSGRYQLATATVDLFEATGVTMSAGAPTMVTGAFAQVTQDTLIPFVYSRSMFDAGHDPQTALVPSAARAALHASFGLPHGILLGPPIAAARFDDWSRDGALSSSLDVAAGDDFGALLPRVYVQDYARRRTLMRPDSTTPGYLDVETRSSRPYVTPVPSGPNIGPAINLTIGEQLASSGGRFRLTDPGPIGIDWITVATATRYELTVLRADDDAGTTRFVPVASLSSAASILEVPAEVFTGGTWFAFRLTVQRNGTLYADGRLRAQDFPYSAAQSVSGLFRIDATCGDGATGAGEDCDSGDLESGACDLDCTIPLCGDGYRNALAFEVCDTITDSFACDDDCTLPVCGDGHVNPNLEDCDDGNIPDTGNGCSTMCKANNVCGDSVVQDAIEECDPPGPACTVNCRNL